MGIIDMMILYSLSYKKLCQPGLISEQPGESVILHYIWWQLGGTGLIDLIYSLSLRNGWQAG